MRQVVKKVLASNILKKTLQVSVLTALVKFVTFFKDILVIKYFPFGEQLDAFFIALVIPQFILSVFISSINSIIIPNYIQEKERSDSSVNLGSFTYTAICINLLVGIVCVITCVTFYKSILSVFSSGSKLTAIGLTRTHFYFLLPSVLFSTVSDSVGALLNSKNKYTITSLTPLYPIIFTIIGLYFFYTSIGIYALSIGFTVGYFAELITMIMVFKLEKFPFNFVFKYTKAIKVLVSQAIHKTSASFFSAFVPLINQYFAVRQPVGSVSLITYAQKVPLFINVTLSMSIGVTVLPYFSNKLIGAKAYEPKSYLRILVLFFLGSLALCVTLLLLSSFIVKLLFLRGKIDIHDLDIVNQLQRIYFAQIPFYLLSILGVRMLTALNSNIQTLYASIMSMVLILLLNYALEHQLGIYGIAVATLGATIFNMLINVWLSYRSLYKLSDK